MRVALQCRSFNLLRYLELLALLWYGPLHGARSFASASVCACLLAVHERSEASKRRSSNGVRKKEAERERERRRRMSVDIQMPLSCRSSSSSSSLRFSSPFPPRLRFLDLPSKEAPALRFSFAFRIYDRWRVDGVNARYTITAAHLKAGLAAA